MPELPEPPSPPRIVPLRRAWGYSWIGVLIGGIHAVLSIVLLVVLLPLMRIDPFGEKDSALDDRNLLAAGRVLSVDDLGFHVGSSAALRFEFEYSVGEDAPRRGTSIGWSDHARWRTDAKVPVEYLEDQPDVARIQGTRLRGAPAWVAALFVASLVLAGSIALVYALRIGQRRRLLETGHVTRGRIVAVRTKPAVNPTPAVLRYEGSDPSTGQAIEGTCWLRAREVPLHSSQLPVPCWIAVAEDLSGRNALLAFAGWQAWE